MAAPKVVVAAPYGRSGKTTICTGLCAALVKRGLVVQPFKKGPDYIDPSWLSAAAGRPCRNLDLFMMSPDALVSSFRRATGEADVAIVEGAMGLYDGLDLTGSGSTAQVARLLGAPIVLTVNVTRMTRSVAALVKGYQEFEPDVQIAGVILNQVATSRQEALITDAIRRYCGLPVLGCLPKDERLTIPERHLGLVPQGESAALKERVEQLGELIATRVDLDALMEVARTGRELFGASERAGPPPAERVRVGVLRDAAFSFYYPDNLEALDQAGADLVFVNALEDENLPAVDALYIGGGFPEMFARELEANASLRAEIARSIDAGLPVYAECAGLLYLARRLHWQGLSAEMVGVLPFDVEFSPKPKGHGYVSGTVVEPNPFLAEGSQFRGHEFHYASLVGLANWPLAYHLTRGHGVGQRRDALVYRNVLAGFTHLHALGVPGWAENVVNIARSAALEPGGRWTAENRSVSLCSTN